MNSRICAIIPFFSSCLCNIISVHVRADLQVETAIVKILVWEIKLKRERETVYIYEGRGTRWLGSALLCGLVVKQDKGHLFDRCVCLDVLYLVYD